MKISRLTTRFLLLAILLLNCGVLQSWAADGKATAPHIKVVAIIPADSPPTYFIDPKTNKPTGFAVDIINRIAELSDMDVSYTVGHGWKEIVEKIKSGEADIIPEIGISEDRRTDLSFTIPLDTFPVGMFVRSNSNLKEITKGLIVGTIQDSFAYEEMRNVWGIHIVAYKSFSQGLYDLLAGRVDVFACPEPVFLRLAKDAGMENSIKMLPIPLGEVKRAIAVGNDNQLLLERLNKTVEGFVGSAEYRQIYQKWYGKPAPVWTQRQIITIFLGVVFLTFIVMLFWRHISVIGLNKQLRIPPARRQPGGGSSSAVTAVQ
jgi:ABC-type amino acid transport substrate-binding protein